MREVTIKEAIKELGLPYKVNPIFPATDKELREYVVSKRPTLRNKKFVIAFSNNRVI